MMQQFDQAPVEADAIESSLATIVEGNTAPSAFSVGKYIYLKRNSTLGSGIFRVKSAIASGDTLSSSNLEQDPNGVVNALNSKMIPSTMSGFTFPLDGNGDAAVVVKVTGRTAHVSFRGISRSHTDGEIFFTIPSGYRPDDNRFFPITISNTAGAARLNTSGEISIYSIASGAGNGRIYANMIWDF